MFNNPKLDETMPHIGEEIEVDGMERYNLEHITRLGFPITLNPHTTTLHDIAIHAQLRQGYSQQTIQHNITYAEFMANHISPVNLFPPNYENFVRHIDYRREIEKAGSHGLRHELKVINMFNRAFGQTEFKVKLPTPPKSHIRILPFPETVKQFFTYKYTKNRDENIALQYLFFHGFLLGIRPPSELCSLTTDHVILEENRGYIIITETKKRDSQRMLIPEYEVLTDYRHKSLKNWLDHWRPRFTSQHSHNHLFIQPSSGKPYSLRHLGHKLSKHGKKIWEHFQPYDMRHWSCTARLIQQKVQTGTFDVYPVKQRHGHEKIQTTMNYLRYAEQYYTQAPFDWIKRVLKHPKKWVEENSLKSIKGQKTSVSNGNPSRDEYGPGRTYISQQKGIFSINITFWVLSKFQHLNKNLSLFLSLLLRVTKRPILPCLQSQQERGGCFILNKDLSSPPIFVPLSKPLNKSDSSRGTHPLLGIPSPPLPDNKPLLSFTNTYLMERDLKSNIFPLLQSTSHPYSHSLHLLSIYHYFLLKIKDYFITVNKLLTKPLLLISPYEYIRQRERCNKNVTVTQKRGISFCNKILFIIFKDYYLVTKT